MPVEVKLSEADKKVYKTPIFEGQVYVDPGLKVMVNLPLNENYEEDQQFEWVNVNGESYQIALGQPVEVPFAVFEALYNSGRFKTL